MERIAAKDRGGALFFEKWPNTFLVKFDETYFMERLDVGLVNDCYIFKKRGWFYKMANKSRYLLDDLRIFLLLIIISGIMDENKYSMSEV